jgi:hypothetical protein
MASCIETMRSVKSRHWHVCAAVSAFGGLRLRLYRPKTSDETKSHLTREFRELGFCTPAVYRAVRFSDLPELPAEATEAE